MCHGEMLAAPSDEHQSPGIFEKMSFGVAENVADRPPERSFRKEC